MICFFIFILTLLDVLLTVYGLISKQIIEVNPIIFKLFNINLMFGAIIIILAAGFTSWFLSKQNLKWIKFACIGLLVIKIFIMFLHVGWLLKCY